MKVALLAAAALALSACATDKVADDETYKPPEYRTGSNLPTKAGSHGSTDVSSADPQAFRNAMPPTITPNRGN